MARLRDYLFGGGAGRGGQATRAPQPLHENFLDAQQASQDFGYQDWAFDHGRGGFGGVGGFGGREFDATQEDPWAYDLWRDA